MANHQPRIKAEHWFREYFSVKGNLSNEDWGHVEVLTAFISDNGLQKDESAAYKRGYVAGNNTATARFKRKQSKPQST